MPEQVCCRYTQCDSASYRTGTVGMLMGMHIGATW